MFANLGMDNLTLDLNDNGKVDLADVDHLMKNILAKRFGDFDLNQKVDISDFRTSIIHYDPWGQNEFHGWTEGNVDGDDDIDFSDILRVAINFSPFGDDEQHMLRSMITADAANQSSPVELMTISTRHEAAIGSIPADFLLPDKHPVDIHPIHDSDHSDNVNHTIDESFFIDHYFRSARRRLSNRTEELEIVKFQFLPPFAPF